MDTMKSFANRLFTYGEHFCRNTAELRANRLSNIFLLIFIGITIALIPTVIIFNKILLDLDADKYHSYLTYYLPFPVFSLSFFSLGYYIKGKTGKIHLILSLVFIYGVIFVSTYSIYLGLATGFYMYLFVLYPLPFLFFNRKAIHLVYITAGIVTSAIIFVMYWLLNYPPLFPVPEDIAKYILIAIIFFTVTSLALCNYYFWHEYHRSEELLLELNSKLKDKEKLLQTELEIAAEIQQGILPENLANFKNFSFNATYLPLSVVSGDFFDIYRHDDCMYFLIADISGHGVPAALVTMLAKQTFSTLFQKGLSPAEVMREANKDMHHKIKTQDYLTAFLAKVDSNLKMTYCNAAHVKPIYQRKNEDAITLLDTNGIMIGAIEEEKSIFENRELQLGMGDRLLFYTDGVVDQRGIAANAYFGVEKLSKLFQDYRNRPMAEFQSHLLEVLHKHRSGRSIEDDITFIGIDVL